MGEDHAGTFRWVMTDRCATSIAETSYLFHSVESKSASLAFSIPTRVSSPASNCSMVGAAKASLTAFGAWPGVAAKVVDGVNAISRLAAAATNDWERQCAGSVNHK